MKRKLFMMLQVALVALLAMSCKGQEPDIPEEPGELLKGKITLLVDQDMIRADGGVANFTVRLVDTAGSAHDVTKDAEIYITEGGGELLKSTSFATEQVGTYTFYALYGFEVSNEVNVSVVRGVVDLPADAEPTKTDFKHRIILLQHTGTACPNCPSLMSTLKHLSEDSAYADRYLHVASHSYSESANYPDPARNPAALQLSSTLGVSLYPWLTFNLSTETAYELEDIKEYIDELQQSKADVGIAASVSCAEGNIYANVAVKAAKGENYRVAVWVLEDGIFASQSGATAQWQNSHNNALRDMAGTEKLDRIYGRSIGYVEAGTTREAIFAVPMGSDWNSNYCEALIIVTAENNKGKFDVVNVATCPVGSSINYDYN